MNSPEPGGLSGTGIHLPTFWRLHSITAKDSCSYSEEPQSSVKTRFTVIFEFASDDQIRRPEEEMVTPGTSGSKENRIISVPFG